jgi:hypothetical protein
MKLERVSRDVRFLISDIVKAGLAGCTTGRSVRHSDLIAHAGKDQGSGHFGVPRLDFFLDMERMLSDQAYSKGVRGMPWRTQAMKDVARCDMPRGGASTL